MKQLELRTSAYINLEKSYRTWLSHLGYSAQTVYMLPLQIREFLHWLELEGIYKISSVKAEDVARFMGYFRNRSNTRRGGGLSQSHINKQSYALKLLSKYLRLSGQSSLVVSLDYEKPSIEKERVLLSRLQIKDLYGVCGHDPIGQRDRAILGIYYGCGLRRSEGVRLRIGDVLFERGLLHVKKTKTNWERYVPMALRVKQDLECYIYGGRKLYASKSSPSELFLTEQGKALSGQSIMGRLKHLLKESGLPSSVTLHGLRHTIATHLLSSGMKLEEVSDFLGHRHLDSSQLYTHLKEREWKKS